MALLSYFSKKTYIVNPHYNRLGRFGETVIMRGHDVCFNGKMSNYS